MPREAGVLSIEDRPWWTQLLFSFPFIGDLSVCQLLLVSFIPVLLAIVYLEMEFLESLVVLVLVLFIGLVAAKKSAGSVLP